jgi:hypothetical protein
MREQLQKLIESLNERYSPSVPAENGLLVLTAIEELNAILAANPEPAVRLRAGWVYKDAAGVWWSEKVPYWVKSEECWDTLSGTAYQWIDVVITDPWPDKPNGGPECVMEVR